MEKGIKYKMLLLLCANKYQKRKQMAPTEGDWEPRLGVSTLYYITLKKIMYILRFKKSYKSYY